ncbi:MAG: hypothetical protein ACPGMX_00140 [Paracoccaceae bacterium]
MSDSDDENEPIIKAKVIEGDAISLSPNWNVDTDLADIINKCSKILKDCGYKDYALAIQDGREERTVFHYAGLAILHAEQTQIKIKQQDSEDAVYNAMRAVQFQNLAIMHHTDLGSDKWADRKSSTGALLTGKFSSEELLELRTEMVIRLRLQNVMEAMIPRHCAKIEGNYLSTGMVPKSKVDKMRKYLAEQGLVKTSK